MSHEAPWIVFKGPVENAEEPEESQQEIGTHGKVIEIRRVAQVVS